MLTKNKENPLTGRPGDFAYFMHIYLGMCGKSRTFAAKIFSINDQYETFDSSCRHFYGRNDGTGTGCREGVEG